jgi:hypothetical protein
MNVVSNDERSPVVVNTLKSLEDLRGDKRFSFITRYIDMRFVKTDRKGHSNSLVYVQFSNRFGKKMRFGTEVMILKTFSPKKLRKYGCFFTQTTATFC